MTAGRSRKEERMEAARQFRRDVRVLVLLFQQLIVQRQMREAAERVREQTRKTEELKIVKKE